MQVEVEVPADEPGMQVEEAVPTDELDEVSAEPCGTELFAEPYA